MKEACQEAFAQQRHLVEVVREKTDASLDWEKIGNEANYLGSVQTMIDRIIASAVSEE